MAYVLRSIVPKEDAAGLAKVTMSAMYTDKHWRLNFPGMPLDEVIAGSAKRQAWNLISGRAVKRHQKAIDLDTGEIVGYARWVVPNGHEDMWLDARIATPTEEDRKAFEASWQSDQVDGRTIGSNPEKISEMSRLLEEVDDEIQKDGPLVELEYLTILPSRQRQGIGAQLVESGLEQASAAGLKTYVMSMPCGVKLYEQHGFVQVKTVIQDSTKFGGSPDHTNVFLTLDSGLPLMDALSSIFCRLARSRAKCCRNSSPNAISHVKTCPKRTLHASSKTAAPVRITPYYDSKPDTDQDRVRRKPRDGRSAIRYDTGRYSESRTAKPQRWQDPDETEIPRWGKRDHTMTSTEREAFSRLFSRVRSRVDHDGLGLDWTGPGRDAVESEDTVDSISAMEQDPEEDAAEDAASVAAYPQPIRTMAAKAQKQQRLEQARLAEAASPMMIEVNKLEAPIRSQMAEATSDVEVWAVVEKELFSRIRALKLDEDPSRVNAASELPSTPIGDINLPVFSIVYRNMLVFALRILCRRTSYTPLAAALLPAVKSLGPSSLAMAVCSGLYNELIAHHWRTNNTIGPILSLLSEMDSLGCPMAATYDILEDITLYRYRASKGGLGRGNWELENMPQRRHEGDQLWEWKRKIQQGLQDAQMEKLRRKEQLEALASEGVFGDGEHAAVPSREAAMTG